MNVIMALFLAPFKQQRERPEKFSPALLIEETSNQRE